MKEMINLDESAWKKELHYDIKEKGKEYSLIFMLIDCSGSTGGVALGSVKSILEDISMEREDSGIHVMIACLSENVTWLNERPIDISHFYNWRKISAGGCLHLGDCCSEVADKIASWSDLELRNQEEKLCFLLISDGMAVDSYESGLKKLKKRPEFSGAKKYAVTVCDLKWAEQTEISNYKVLSEFTGDMDSVMDVSCMEAKETEEVLKKIIFGR